MVKNTLLLFVCYCAIPFWVFGQSASISRWSYDEVKLGVVSDKYTPLYTPPNLSIDKRHFQIQEAQKCGFTYLLIGTMAIMTTVIGIEKGFDNQDTTIGYSIAGGLCVMCLVNDIRVAIKWRRQDQQTYREPRKYKKRRQ